MSASITPDVAEWTCDVSVRRRWTRELGWFDEVISGPDNCGRAMFVAVLRNCVGEPVTVAGDVTMTVDGPESDSASYWAPSNEVPPGGELRIPVEPRGIGEVTVVFPIERRGSARSVVEAHARTRRVVRTTYE